MVEESHSKTASSRSISVLLGIVWGCLCASGVSADEPRSDAFLQQMLNASGQPVLNQPAETQSVPDSWSNAQVPIAGRTQSGVSGNQSVGPLPTGWSKPGQMPASGAGHAAAQPLQPPTRWVGQPAPHGPQHASSQHPFWWNAPASTSVLARPRWVAFDLQTVLFDTLQNSPRIKSLTHQTGMALERIVQQDAAFDPTMLFGGTGGRTNDPVGNTLTTGGATRLQETSSSMRGGIRRNGRRGTEFGLTQEMGILDSNSTFFSPADQGNARLSLSLTQPLLARGGQVYNERLLTQAKLDSRVSWHEMRGDVESRISEVMTSYWRLYESRCHLLQQRQLLRRGQDIERLVQARGQLDSGRIELAKTRTRVARRQDQLVVLEAEVKKRQTRLATLIGSDALCGTDAQLELIPKEAPTYPMEQWDIRDVTIQALENRPEIKAATSQLEAAGLAVKVTRTELVPQLNAVVNSSLSALNGENNFGRSFLDQFSGVVPGFSAGLQYEMPYGRRAARARHREAHHQYRQRAEELREAIQQTQWEVESALIDARRAAEQHKSKHKLLLATIEEESYLTRHWQLLGGDGTRVGVVLENLLDAQQRRTDAEREYVTSQSDYMASLVDLQRAMGTLLRYEGITPTQRAGNSNVEFVHHGRDHANVALMTPQPIQTAPTPVAPIQTQPQLSHTQRAQMPQPLRQVPVQQAPVQQVPVQQVPVQQVPLQPGTALPLQSRNLPPPVQQSPSPGTTLGNLPSMRAGVSSQVQPVAAQARIPRFPTVKR